jgi:hypothetical protein
VEAIFDPGSSKVSAAGCVEMYGEGNEVLFSCTANGVPGHAPRTGLVQGRSSARNKFMVLVNDAVTPRDDHSSNKTDIVLDHANSNSKDNISAVLAELHDLHSEVAALRATIHETGRQGDDMIATPSFYAFASAVGGLPTDATTDLLSVEFEQNATTQIGSQLTGHVVSNGGGGVARPPGEGDMSFAMVTSALTEPGFVSYCALSVNLTDGKIRASGASVCLMGRLRHPRCGGSARCPAPAAGDTGADV